MAQWVDRYWTSTDGLKLHYRDYAGPHERPPLLCLPGLTRNARDFEPLADRLAGDWRVIAVDFRGRGLSQPDPKPENYHPATYAADLLKLLDQLGIADAVFVGTSLGGIVTSVFAANDSERVAGAVLNDIGPVIEPVALERLASFVGTAEAWPDWEAAARGVAARNRIAFPHFRDEDWLPYARRLASERPDGTVALDYDAAIGSVFAGGKAPPPDVDPWPMLDGLKEVPVLVLRGEISDLLSAATAEKMLDHLGDCELVTVPGVGHSPVLDEPEAAAAIDRLLAKVLARG